MQGRTMLGVGLAFVAATTAHAEQYYGPREIAWMGPDRPEARPVLVSEVMQWEHPDATGSLGEAVMSWEHPDAGQGLHEAVMSWERPDAGQGLHEAVMSWERPDAGQGLHEAVMSWERPDANLGLQETVMSWERPDASETVRLPSAEAELTEERPAAFPNPSSGSVTVSMGSTDVSVDVYDVTGRRVASFAGSAGRADWDGRDVSGRTVSAGIYFARVTSRADAPAHTVRLVRK
ncbi:MAG: T9SS type A sorting domain-containing protein [bacterium]